MGNRGHIRIHNRVRVHKLGNRIQHHSLSNQWLGIHGHKHQHRMCWLEHEYDWRQQRQRGQQRIRGPKISIKILIFQCNSSKPLNIYLRNAINSPSFLWFDFWFTCSDFKTETDIYFKFVSSFYTKFVKQFRFIISSYWPLFGLVILLLDH